MGQQFSQWARGWKNVAISRCQQRQNVWCGCVCVCFSSSYHNSNISSTHIHTPETLIEKRPEPTVMYWGFWVCSSYSFNLLSSALLLQSLHYIDLNELNYCYKQGWSRCIVVWCCPPVMLDSYHRAALLFQVHRGSERGGTSAPKWVSTGASKIRKPAGLCLACGVSNTILTLDRCGHKYERGIGRLRLALTDLWQANTEMWC